MSPDLANLKAQASHLNVEDRAELAYFLLDGIPAEHLADDDVEFLAELERRAAEVDSGRILPIPAETVFAEIRNRHR